MEAFKRKTLGVYSAVYLDEDRYHSEIFSAWIFNMPETEYFNMPNEHLNASEFWDMGEYI